MRSCVLSCVIALLVIVLSTAPIAPALAGEWVDFNTATVPPSKFKIKKAKEKGIELKPELGEPIRGELYRPKGDGPFPAVVMLHGCAGIEPYHESWAEIVASWHYVVLLIDSFGPRGIKEDCIHPLNVETGTTLANDAHGALQYLMSLSYVDPNRAAIIGWSRRDFLGVVARDGVQQMLVGKFRAAIAFYPDCFWGSTGQFYAPLLVLIGADDDWSLVSSCQAMTKAGKDGPAPIEMIVYPGVYNRFDNPDAGEPHLVDYENRNKTPARGATLGYDHAAHEDATKHVKAFLDAHLR